MEWPFVLITHNMGIVAETCDDVAVMYMGHIVESGERDDIFFNPLHPYTKSLLRVGSIVRKENR